MYIYGKVLVSLFFIYEDKLLKKKKKLKVDPLVTVGLCHKMKKENHSYNVYSPPPPPA